MKPKDSSAKRSKGLKARPRETVGPTAGSVQTAGHKPTASHKPTAKVNSPSRVPSRTDSPSTDHCRACSALDKADGNEDGAFGHVVNRVRNENHLLASLKRFENRSADKITTFAGSMKFIYIHLGWFAVWIAINVGLAGLGHEFDKFPFGLLTMIVSLEAIFLATFVMISQNRQSTRSELRSDIDFENNVRAEIWSIHIGHELGIDPDHVERMVQQALLTAQHRLRDDF
jgi:uncharacterized membrane protein